MSDRPRPGAPFIEVRIERPRTLEVLDGLWASGLVTIDFFPPASGPEIALWFGAFDPSAPKPTAEVFETFVKGMVEQATGQTVLAITARSSADVDLATGVSR